MSSTSASGDAERLKGEGNAKFSAGDYDGAIDLFTQARWERGAPTFAPKQSCPFPQAIALDPSCHVYHSNRSAAYLAKGDPQLALEDAERCIQANPAWAKGYSRRGAALHALKRFSDAVAAYKNGLALDPANASLRAAVKAVEADRKAALAKLREEDAAMAAAGSGSGAGAASGIGGDRAGDVDEDLLSSFMSEIRETEIAQKKRAIGLDLDPVKHIERLLHRNHEWRNLNPYWVLSLPADAGENDVKRRYKQLSMIVHPDKVADPRASDAFQEVKKAYEVLMDEEEKRRVDMLIKQARTAVLRERKKLTAKGVPEDQLVPLEGALEKETMKIFAQWHRRRAKSKELQQGYRAKEKMAEEEEKEKEKVMREREKHWTSGREKRVRSWYSFTGNAKKARQKGPAIPMEMRDGVKRFKDGEEYKASWK